MGRLQAFLTLACIAACVGNHSQRAVASAESTPPSFDVAGVKLGMTPAEVRALLATRGFPTHEFQATLNHIDIATGKNAEIPDSEFVNAIVQTAPSAAGAPTDNLTVFFSPNPGHEQVVAVARHNSYPPGHEPHELDLKKEYAEKYGDIPPLAASPRYGFQFSRVWSVPTNDSVMGESCRFNLVERAAQAGWWNSRGVNLKNYVITNRDLILELGKKKCGPNIVEINWHSRDPNLPAQDRVLDEHTVSILSLPVAQEAILAAGDIIGEVEAKTGRVARNQPE